MRAAAKALLIAGPALDTITIPSLMTLLRMVLTLNNFEFNGEHYLQTGGTAMGTRLAPSYMQAIYTIVEFLKETHVDTHPHQPFGGKDT